MSTGAAGIGDHRGVVHDPEDRDRADLPVDPDDADEEHVTIGRRGRDIDVVVAIAGAAVLGSLARYGISERGPVRPGEIPWSTLGINLVGSLALGFLLVLLVERFAPMRYARAFIAIGFIGAFTTFSTFAVETVDLLADRAGPTAAAYVALSLVGGLLCAFVGVRLARRIPHRHPPAPVHPSEVDDGA